MIDRDLTALITNLTIVKKYTSFVKGGDPIYGDPIVR